MGMEVLDGEGYNFREIAVVIGFETISLVKTKVLS